MSCHAAPSIDTLRRSSTTAHKATTWPAMDDRINKNHGCKQEQSNVKGSGLSSWSTPLKGRGYDNHHHRALTGHGCCMQIMQTQKSNCLHPMVVFKAAQGLTGDIMWHTCQFVLWAHTGAWKWLQAVDGDGRHIQPQHWAHTSQRWSLALYTNHGFRMENGHMAAATAIAPQDQARASTLECCTPLCMSQPPCAHAGRRTRQSCGVGPPLWLEVVAGN
jgi:hypothetical protein